MKPQLPNSKTKTLNTFTLSEKGIGEERVSTDEDDVIQYIYITVDCDSKGLGE